MFYKHESMFCVGSIVGTSEDPTRLTAQKYHSWDFVMYVGRPEIKYADEYTIVYQTLTINKHRWTFCGKTFIPEFKDNYSAIAAEKL